MLPSPPAEESAQAPGLQPGPLPSETPSADTGDVAGRQGPAGLPYGPRGPGGPPERPDLASGPHGLREMPGTKPGAPQIGKEPGWERPAGGPPHRADTLPGHANLPPKPPTEAPAPETVAMVKRDTVPAEQPSAPGADTTRQVSPPAKLQLEIVHFATDSWQIQPAESARLKADAESLKARPEVKVVIVGHCDPRASERYNQRLGLKRAEAVRDFLVAAGVDSGRISVRSDGEKRPISTKPDEFWLDRRVEFEYR